MGMVIGLHLYSLCAFNFQGEYDWFCYSIQLQLFAAASKHACVLHISFVGLKAL